MFDEWLVEFNDLILQLGYFINEIFSIPSKLIPLLSSNMILIAISILFGYFFSKKVEMGYKTLFAVIFSLLFYMALRFIGVAS